MTTSRIKMVLVGAACVVCWEDPEWEHNAAVLDDLVHDGFALGPDQDLHDGAGAYFSTDGICLTDAGRRHLSGAESRSASAHFSSPRVASRHGSI